MFGFVVVVCVEVGSGLVAAAVVPVLLVDDESLLDPQPPAATRIAAQKAA